MKIVSKKANRLCRCKRRKTFKRIVQTTSNIAYFSLVSVMAVFDSVVLIRRDAAKYSLPCQPLLLMCFGDVPAVMYRYWIPKWMSLPLYSATSLSTSIVSSNSWATSRYRTKCMLQKIVFTTTKYNTCHYFIFVRCSSLCQIETTCRCGIQEKNYFSALDVDASIV